MRSKNYIFLFELFKLSVDYDNSIAVNIDIRNNHLVREDIGTYNMGCSACPKYSYHEITITEAKELLEQAYATNSFYLGQEEQYRKLKDKTVFTVDDIYEPEEQRKRFIEHFVYYSSKNPIHNDYRMIEEKLYQPRLYSYVNYDYQERTSFEEFMLNRYSVNNGYFVKISKTDIGYRLIVVYHYDDLKQLTQNNELHSFMRKYLSGTLDDSFKVCLKDLTDQEFYFLMQDLYEKHFFELLASNMENRGTAVGCTGPCDVYVRYVDKVILGHTDVDDEKICGVNFGGFIQNCIYIASPQYYL